MVQNMLYDLKKVLAPQCFTLHATLTYYLLTYVLSAFSFTKKRKCHISTKTST